jgi:hypothetical protein
MVEELYEYYKFQKTMVDQNKKNTSNYFLLIFFKQAESFLNKVEIADPAYLIRYQNDVITNAED